MHVMSLIPGLVSQLAGGCEMTDDWTPLYVTMVGLVQGTPYDEIFVLEMYSLQITPSITLTPINPPITIPASGGSFNFDATLQNPEPNPIYVDVWTKALLPTGVWYGPILGPINICLPPAASITKTRTQAVPGGAPAGVYAYWGYLGDYPSSIWSSDSFPFEKLATGDGTPDFDWANYGECFDPGQSPNSQPTEFTFSQAYPNPFNPATTISFTLPKAAGVILNVYDISGRQVATLVNGWRDAGSHEVVFDGSALASGIYVYRLSTDNLSTVGKMVLMK